MQTQSQWRRWSRGQGVGATTPPGTFLVARPLGPLCVGLGQTSGLMVSLGSQEEVKPHPKALQWAHKASLSETALWQHRRHAVWKLLDLFLFRKTKSSNGEQIVIHLQ